MFLFVGIVIFLACKNSNQAISTFPLPLQFVGEYSQNGGEWQTLRKDTNLSAYDGDKVETITYPNASDDANNPSYGRITFDPGKDNVLSDLKDSKTGQLLNNTKVYSDTNMHDELGIPKLHNYYNISTRASDNDIYQLLKNNSVDK